MNRSLKLLEQMIEDELYEVVILEASTLLLETLDKYKIMKLEGLIGRAYLGLSNHEKARYYSEKALEKANHLINKAHTMKYTLILTKIELMSQNNEKAKSYVLSALAYYQSIDDQAKIGLCYSYLGTVYEMMQELDTAEYYFNKALTYETQLLPSSILYIKLKLISLKLTNEEYKIVLTMAKALTNEIGEIGNLQTALLLHRTKSIAYYGLKKYRKSELALRKGTEYKHYLNDYYRALDSYEKILELAKIFKNEQHITELNLIINKTENIIKDELHYTNDKDIRHSIKWTL